MKIEQLEWSNYHKVQPVMATLDASEGDRELMAIGGIFWNLIVPVKQWLAANTANHEIRYNDVDCVLPEIERIMTHKVYILFYGDCGYTPMSQALMFKLRWAGNAV